ncbi:bacillithiol system redox-active protein YtxJ [Robiginitalea sp. SC105]|uniref:bacillithiol system redox-active protein YtxJ n=1 Tax=Robiginitalea sp. SC105 TaxID=2762332 RepID=UPI001639B820|nr:bacillithiol system redox-active protein YtxJ [Robiginitalea sp. SC105]MBC2840743.1 bacillithiol system redox-active protein YtxJ [Robiginitalea sp. SC105]
MGISKVFGNLFGTGGQSGSQDTGQIPWKRLAQGPGDVLSGKGPDTPLQVVFKHSNSCGLSRIMLNRFENKWPGSGIDYYLVDVRQDREISQALARELDCTHQSPQVLILREGQLLAHASHGDIDRLQPAAYLE